MLKKLGIFVCKQSVSPDACQKMVTTLKSCKSTHAEVRKNGANYLNRETRRTRLVTANAFCYRTIDRYLEQLKPELESFFNTSLNCPEETQFLRYRPGDYFSAHIDADLNTQSTDYKRRKISVIFFLNGARSNTHPPKASTQSSKESYQNGELFLYGLLDSAKAKNVGLPVAGQSGLLVAFTADLLHEVRPVTSGERFSAVTWYH